MSDLAAKTISVKGRDSKEAAAAAKQQLCGFEPKLIVFFASSIYEETNPAKELAEAFHGCKAIGSTSHSEFCNAMFSEHTISIMALDSDSVEDCWIEVIEEVDKWPPISFAIDRIHLYFGGRENILNNFDRYVGVVLFESSSRAEEEFMDKLGTKSDIFFVGGASSSAENNISRVYADGASYENAVVLAVMKTTKGYEVFKTQSAELYSDKSFTVTQSDVSKRIVYEFDDRPCGEVYAEVLGIDLKDISDYFVSNPLGVLAGEEIFIRTFDKIIKQGITVHCGIPVGTEIHVLKTGDIVKDTKQALDEHIPENIAGLINFNCIYRTFEIENKNLVAPYCGLFGQYNSIGFSTSGEAFLGYINETSTILVIK